MSSAKHPDRRDRLAFRHHPTRRDGAVALALFALPTAIGLIMELHYHRLDIATLSVLVSVALGLPLLWLTWATYRDSRNASSEAGERSLAEIADLLAITVRAQWEAEVAVRRLNDPYPLPVSWVAADMALADDWAVLVTLATSGAGWPAPLSPGIWATGPEGLSGSGNQLSKILERVPTRRLVVLGEPGSGKTMLMVRLVLDLLADRVKGGAVPVLFSLASWDPAGQELRDWLVTRLSLDYPALGAAEGGSGQRSLGRALLADRLILPVLDGLDEMSQEGRIQAAARISDSLRPGEAVVVTCRAAAYREIISREAGILSGVRAAAVIELRPLDAVTVSDYLRRDAGPGASARWDPVLAVLGTAAPAGQALVSPLMVGLARAVYNPRPGEREAGLGDPAELCQLPDRAALDAHLFDAFIPASYRHQASDRWNSRRAEEWLVFLARYLEHTIKGPDFAWWQLPLATESASFRNVAGLGFGLVAGLGFGLVAGLGYGLVAGPAAGLAAGIMFGIVGDLVSWFVFGVAARTLTAERTAVPWRAVRFRIWKFKSFRTGLVPGLMSGLLFLFGLQSGFVFGLVYALLFGLYYFMSLFKEGVEEAGVPIDLTGTVSPGAVLLQDRRATLITAAAAGLLIGPVVGLMIGLSAGLVPGLVLGVMSWLLTGMLIIGSIRPVWLAYVLSRSWLALHHQLPWSLMRFLSDAHQRGIMRQVGSVYQFRHIELQRRLASRPSRPVG